MKERKKKQLWTSFSYRECDAFAEFLQKQSLLGWHFTGWKYGLVFEKGEPQEISYRVEVFEKASEMDLSSNSSTKEYADYCEYAGWEFIDSQRKFCVFRQKKEEARPIVTEEERFETIRKAEWQNWRERSIFVLLIIGMTFFASDWKDWLFSTFSLIAAGTWIAIGMIKIAEGIMLFAWERKTRALLARGEQVAYVQRGIPKRVLNALILFALCVRWMSIETANQNAEMLFALGIVFLLLLCDMILAIWRPMELDNIVFQTFLGFGIVGIWLAIGALAQDSAPDRVHTQSVFGSYDAGEIEESTVITYEVYRSDFDWILDQVWKEYESETEDVENYAGKWGAKEAYRIGDDTFSLNYIRYEDAVVYAKMNAEKNR